MIEEFPKDINPEYVPPANRFKRDNALKKIFLLVIFTLTILALLITALSFRKSIEEESPQLPKTEEPLMSRPPEPTFTPSFLATDAGLLKTKTEIEENIKYTNSVDLSELNLNFPLLDFNINFEK